MRLRLQSWALSVTCLLFTAAPLCAAGRPVQVCVQDQRGLPISGARVQLLGDPSHAVVIDAGGCGTVNGEGQTPGGVTRDGFSRVVRALGDQNSLAVVMQVAGAVEEVQVTATRSPLALNASASSVR